MKDNFKFNIGEKVLYRDKEYEVLLQKKATTHNNFYDLINIDGREVCCCIHENLIKRKIRSISLEELIKKNKREMCENTPNEDNYYKHGNKETKDIIRDILGNEGYKNFCAGNVIKYVSRYPFKHEKVEDKIVDLEKAKDYIDFIISVLEEER